jgi:hypothetical protein
MTQWALIKESLTVIAAMSFISSANSHGLDDIPIFTHAKLIASASITTSPDYEFTYQYSITNSEKNTGEIWSLTLDISTKRAHYEIQDFPKLNTAPLPRGSTRSMIENAIDGAPYIGKLGSAVVPLGQTAPLGWAGGYARSGTVSFSGLEPEAKILPGQSLSGFSIVSKYPPSLRDATLDALWFHISDSDEPSDEEWALVADAVDATRIESFTLGPSPEGSLGTYAHWINFEADVLRLFDINWITHTGVAEAVEQELLEAKTALDLNDGKLAKQRLATLRTLVTNAPSGSIISKAVDLLLTNIDVLIDKTPDTPLL